MAQRFLILNLVFISAVGCTTAGLRVESQPPGAEVQIIVPGQPPRKVGQTPVDINEFAAAGAPAIQVTAKAPGRQSQSVVVPASVFAKRGQVYFQLDEAILPATCEKQDESLQKVARGVAEVQSQIASKRLDQAESTLTMLTSEFSGVSVLYDLMGNVYYLKKDLNNALIQYKRSYEINSNNAETARMIRKIESLRGGGA